jgi:hypothetical protein
VREAGETRRDTPRLIQPLRRGTLPAELHGSGWAVQAVQGTLDGSRPDTSDAIFTIRRMASVRPNMESVSVVSVIALRARLDREAPEPSVAARVAHRVSVALVQHVAANPRSRVVRDAAVLRKLAAMVL